MTWVRACLAVFRQAEQAVRYKEYNTGVCDEFAKVKFSDAIGVSSCMHDIRSIHG
ncbi:MAG TPA: hypothetical protein VJ984_00290 [Xanthomonadales bacterium]|nr:hypothetical protein [Xanthomonadales bacterium]